MVKVTTFWYHDFDYITQMSLWFESKKRQLLRDNQMSKVLPSLKHYKITGRVKYII